MKIIIILILLLMVGVFYLLKILLKRKLDLADQNDRLLTEMNKLNKKLQTNFRVDRGVRLKIFFDTYQKKIYIHNINGFNGLRDIDFFTSWEIDQTKIDKPYYRILIYTTLNDLPPIELKYNNYYTAEADLNKLNSYIKMLSS